MQKHKGNAYDPVDVVSTAIAKTGWSPETFFTRAKTFGKTNGFNALAEAEKFKDFRTNPTAVPIQIPAPVLAFADWVQIKSVSEVMNKFH